MSQFFKIFKSEKRKLPPKLPKRDYYKYSSIGTKDSKISKMGYNVIFITDYCDPIDCKVKYLESIEQINPIKKSSKSLIDLDSIASKADYKKCLNEEALFYSYSLPLTDSDHDSKLSIETDSLMIETSHRETPSPQSVNCSQHLSRILKENFQPIKSILSDKIKDSRFDNRTSSKCDKKMAVLNRWSKNGSKFDNKTAINSVSLFKENLYPSHRRQGSESSFSFTTDQSSVSSVTSSSPSSSGDSSSILKHLDSLPSAAILPKRQGIKTNLNIPRSKSSDITVNLVTLNKPQTESIRGPKTKLGSTYYLLKSTTCDAISSLDSDSDSSTKCLLESQSNQELTKLTTGKMTPSTKTSTSDFVSKNLANQSEKSIISLELHKSENLDFNQKIKMKQNSENVKLTNDSSISDIHSHSNDTRPLNDYDTPWDTEQKITKATEEFINNQTQNEKVNQAPNLSNKLKSLSNDKKQELITDISKSIQSQTTNQLQTKSIFCLKNKSSPDTHSLPSTSCKITNISNKSNKLTLNLNSNVSDNLSSLSNLTLGHEMEADETGKIVTRKKPTLSFNHQILPVVSENVDSSLPLEKQGWYHGSITRFDAENLLRSTKEGSYLIRNCESTKQDFSLSLKSMKGFMHMKIVKNDENKYVLGVFSKPFSTIPEMVKHYTINKLPIRGAEHMSLLYPVIDQLL